MQYLFDRAVKLNMCRVLRDLVGKLRAANEHSCFKFDFDDTAVADATIRVEYTPTESLHADDDIEPSNIVIQILVDRRSGHYIVHCASFDSDNVWSHLADELASLINKSFENIPNALKLLRYVSRDLEVFVKR